MAEKRESGETAATNSSNESKNVAIHQNRGRKVEWVMALTISDLLNLPKILSTNDRETTGTCVLLPNDAGWPNNKKIHYSLDDKKDGTEELVMHRAAVDGTSQKWTRLINKRGEMKAWAITETAIDRANSKRICSISNKRKDEALLQPTWTS